MKRDLSRYAPPGLELRLGKNLFSGSMACAVIICLLQFWIHMSDEKARLFWYEGSIKILPGAVMAEFPEVMEKTMIGFPMVILCMAALIVYHYVYHRQGSKSIYLMKRLPDRMELHRRCLTLPLLGMGLCIAAVVLLTLICFCIYLLATPAECLPPGQWRNLWRVMLCLS